MNLIEYPKHIIWKKPLPAGTALDNFSKKHAKRIKFVIDKEVELSITHTLEPITDEFLKWFKEYYLTTIQGKTNPNIAGIDLMLAPYNIPVQCYGLKIMDHDQIVGGAIYIHKKHHITTALKVFNANWHSTNLPASPSLYSEYLLYTHAIKFGYGLISHGKDSNPYGLNSDIGLCAYKLSLGYTPSIGKNTVTGVLDSSKISNDCLVLEYPPTGRIVTTGRLFCSEESLAKYSMVTNYKDILTIAIILQAKFI